MNQYLMTKILAFAFVAAIFAGCAMASASPATDEVIVGAAQVDEYEPMLKGKRVALFSNHTGMVGDRHTIDVMRDAGINVVTIFSPEHGFRGNADAGEHVSSSVDTKTGVPIVSLYGSKAQRTPSKEVMDGIDVIVTDIQDVGLRFYTYYCTMVDLMNAAAAHGKDFVVFDRPNPNGSYVDGPILDMRYRSGVGWLPIPIVHGMTMGELARMAVGEGWSKRVDLSVVPCRNYTRSTRYVLPLAPSPNLPTQHSIYLYPSMCLFEGTGAISASRRSPMPARRLRRTRAGCVTESICAKCPTRRYCPRV